MYIVTSKLETAKKANSRDYLFLPRAMMPISFIIALQQSRGEVRFAGFAFDRRCIVTRAILTNAMASWFPRDLGG